MKYAIKSLKEMNAFASKFAKSLKGGEVLALTGELGAGKTSFVQALAKALGVKAVVQSPTFLLMKCYTCGKNQEPPPKADLSQRLISTRPTPLAETTNFQKLCHVDAYRIKTSRELFNIGIAEHLNDPQTVTAIEWADRVKEIIPKNAIKIRFAHGKNDNERLVSVTRNK